MIEHQEDILRIRILTNALDVYSYPISTKILHLSDPNTCPELVAKLISIS